jgi:glycosyltransferase involved in cell wall biosynthesis
MIDVSVLLATYDRADFLESCIDSLCRQTLDASRYEICVINNACTDNTSDVVARMAARYPDHRLFEVVEPTPGLSRARNCGMRHAAYAGAAGRACR